MGFISEDRKTEGLVLQLSIRDNSLLALRSLSFSVRRRYATRSATVTIFKSWRLQ